MKRYVAEPGSEEVRAAMQAADRWAMCRVGYVETARAIGLAAGEGVVRRFENEWPAFTVVEVDAALAGHAASLAAAHDLRSLDALHLAAALTLPRGDLVLATYDRRLHGAARGSGLDVDPAPST